MNYSFTPIYLLLIFLLSFSSCQSNAQKGVDLAPAAFKSTMEKTEDAVILDVRTPEEVAQGIIPNAKVINFFDADFKEQLKKLDKDKTYFVYCKGGGRSGKTCNALQEAGYPKAYNLEGGITAWKKAGLETVQQ